MCHCNAEGCKGCRCMPSLIAKVLVIVGGVNWGLVGLGTLISGADANWNVVNMLLGSMPTLEAVVYVLVGVAAVMKIFHCKCKKCMGGVCTVHGNENMPGKM
mgnify:CR=1 FL=1